jgi:hypothetical protein
MVDLANFLLVDPVGGHDELAVMTPPAVLLALYSLIVIASLVRGFDFSLALMFAEDCTDGLLTEGVACCMVEQLPRHSRFAAYELMNEHFIGHAGEECFDHIRIHDRAASIR